MPKRKGVAMTEQEQSVTPEPVWGEPEATEPVEVVGAPARRIVKLAAEPTMWLLEDGVLHAFTCSGDAAALRLPVEVVDDLREWTQGDVYAG